MSCSDSVTASPLRSTASTEPFRRGSAAGTPQAGRATRGQRRRAGPRCRAGGLAGAGSSIENGSPRRVVAQPAATVPDRRCLLVLGAGQLRSSRHRSRPLHATAVVRSHVPIAEPLTGMPQVKVAACARPSRKTRLVRVSAGVPYPGHRTDACRLLPQRQVERSSQDPVFAGARDRQQSDRDRDPSALASRFRKARMSRSSARSTAATAEGAR